MGSAAIRITVAAVVLAACAAAAPAAAHELTSGIGGGFISGLTHPVFGWDHVAAMVAVGIWGAFLGSPAIWLLPIVFPLIMAAGGALGILGVAVPQVEAGIAVSAVVLGLLIALSARPPLWAAVLIVGIFAIFHGHAHGTELPEAAHPVAYAVGFVVATGLLHLIGIAVGLLAGRSIGAMIARAGGAAISVAGFGFFLGIL